MLGSMIIFHTPGETPLVTSSIASLPAGESRVVTLDLGQFKGTGFYIGVSLSAVERNPADNILLVGNVPSWPAYLPIVNR